MRVLATHTIAASLGFWAALWIEHAYRHEMHRPIERLTT